MEIPQHIVDAADDANSRWNNAPPELRNMTQDPVLVAVYPLIYAQALEDVAVRLAATGSKVEPDVKALLEQVGDALRTYARFLKRGGTLNPTPDRSRRLRVRAWFSLNRQPKRKKEMA